MARQRPKMRAPSPLQPTPMPTALLVVDAQQSFTRRPYFQADGVAPFLSNLSALIAGAVAQGIPVVRVFHVDPPESAHNPFARASGLIRPLEGLVPFEAAFTVEKSRHSALAGTAL